MTRTLVLDAVESAPLLASTPSGRTYLFLLRGADLIAQTFDEASGSVGGEPVVLVSDIGQVASPAVRPSVGVSPGVLAYQSGGASLRGQLAWVDRSGADVDRLSVDASVDLAQASPDGLFVAGSRLDSATSSNVWVTDLRRGSSTRITFSGFTGEVAWSPDGTRLAFRRRPISSSAPGIYVIGADGANERRLTAQNGRVTSWSTDGKYILYDSAAKLMMMDATGDGDPIDVGPRNSSSTLVTFSPDTRFIAYHSNESGRAEIYVRAAPPTTQRIKVSINGGISPRWRRDGKEIYFLNQDAIMAVEVEATFSAGVPRELFKTTGGLQ